MLHSQQLRSSLAERLPRLQESAPSIRTAGGGGGDGSGGGGGKEEVGACV